MKSAWAEFPSTKFTHLGSVESTKLGGFLLTIIVAVTGIAAAVPIGILLELGRRSSMIVFRSLCVAFIEFVRGVPLLILLFASFVLLTYTPPLEIVILFDFFLRAALVVTLPSGVYVAEAIRGGFAAIARGQYEAAAALGLGYCDAMRLVILPQVLKLSQPRILMAAT
ncbi:MAG: ABC transporter permease subunit [Paracoccaceae bacterium]|nr:ABC transporter permease subunit [Paracoccaceae bacterium]